MKIKTFLVRSLTLAAGLCAASNIVNASTVANFSDSWKDAALVVVGGSDNGFYTNKTAGTFSVDLSLPCAVGSSFDVNTEVSLALWDGVSAIPVTIFDYTLGYDQNYINGAKSAKFPIVTTNGVTNGSVTVSWSATTISVVGSSQCDLLDEEANYTSSFKSNFNVGAINLAVNGGALFSYVNNEVPVAGKNTTTPYSKANPDGSVTSMEAGSISAVSDFTLPKVAITYPANKARINTSDMTFQATGTASDYYNVTSLQYTISNSIVGSQPLQTIDVPLNVPTLKWQQYMTMPLYGSNLITVYAVNSLNLTNTASVTVIMVSNNPVLVQVLPAGTGTVKGLKNGEIVQMGNGYNVTATPANNQWIFAQWTDGSGNVLSNLPAFNYVANPGATGTNTLIADFTNNPFYDSSLAGTYEGLYFDTNGVVTPDDAGYITVTVTANADFTGKVYIPATGSAYSFNGQLAWPAGSTNAIADSKVKVDGLEDLDIQFGINTDSNLNVTEPGAGSFIGTITSTTPWQSSIQGLLALDTPNITPGLYNIVLSPESNPANGPGGYSVLTATVKDTGGVVLALTLADGTSPVTSFSTSLGLGGVCPVYASLYSGRGVIIGALQFNTDGSQTVTNYSLNGSVVPINWIKNPVGDKFYTNGFGYGATASGEIFKPLSIFDWTTNGFFDVDAGYLGYVLADDTGGVDLSFNPLKNTLVDPTKRDKVSITLSPSTGAFTGSFGAVTFNLQTNTVATPAFRGVATLDYGWGFYMATNKVPGTGTVTGPVIFGAAP